MKFKKNSTEFDISVIIPVYNSGQDICRTIDALVQQEYPSSKYEVIVVDNGSTDNTVPIVRDYCERYPGLVKLLFQNEVQSSYAARNTGISHASGEILAFVDADMWMDATWLCSVVNEMESMDIDYMGCRVDIQSIEPTRNLAALYNKVIGFPIEESIARHHFTPTCCLVTKAALFKKVGKFDESLMSGGDYEFGNRAFQQGIELHYAPHIVLYHPARATLRSLKKKYLRVGKGLYQIAQRHPNLVPHERRGLVRRFLPPNPVSFIKKLKTRAKVRDINISGIQVFRLYFIDCYVKWSTSIGYMAKRITSSSDSAGMEQR